MSYFITNDEPTITLSLVKDDMITRNDYFPKFSSIDNNNELITKNDPPITMNNQNLFHHPLSRQFIDQKAHSAPLLQQQQQQQQQNYLIPPSILVKHINSSPTIPKHITLTNEGEERRPSVITFKSSDTKSIFYDAKSTFLEEDIIVEEKETKEKTTFWKKRRPSIKSRISSSAYTNKTTAITIEHIEQQQQQQQQGNNILLVSIICKRKQEMEKQQKYHHQIEFNKRPLKWRHYKAILTQSGYLELYNVCQCHQNTTTQLLHACFHFRHDKKPKHIIDLSFETFKLLLMSPIDFSWSLTSSNTIYYFQSCSVHISQQWYRSLYTALPPKSKLALPKTVDLVIPELSTSIRLPLAELCQRGGGDENIELRKVLRSALILLHRHGNKPTQWNQHTVGLCWKYNDHLDWVLKPTDDDGDVAYLIEPRLIEKTHELQLRFYYSEQEEEKDDSDEKSSNNNILLPNSMGGYLTDNNNTLLTPLYALTMDQFLFLYEDMSAIKKKKRFSTTCFQFNKVSSSCSIEDYSPRLAMGMIDLKKITEITEEEHLLQLNEYSFQVMHHQQIHDWSTRLDSIQKYYSSTQKRSRDILQCNDMYIKMAKSKYQPFESRYCILTKSGDLCLFKSSSKSKEYKVMEMSLSLVKEEVYIYSGEECCSYITRLPLQGNCRIFDNGSIEEENKPNQCCFVIHFREKDYVFLTRSPKQKESWVQSICSFLM